MTRAYHHLIACSCFFGSGFLALAYEICWIRKASLVFGAEMFALSTVLAVFFAGLALGSYAFGRYSRQTTRPLRTYAVLEIVLGGVVMLSPLGFTLADSIYEQFYPQVGDSFVLLSLTRFILVAVLLLAPAILMGGTLPLFCRQYVLSERRIVKSVGFLYGLNTLGAAAGCAASGFFLIPRVGVDTTLYVGGVLNILIGAIIWWLPLKAAAPSGTSAGPERRSLRQTHSAAPLPSRRSRTVLYFLFFMSGFVALGSEILWTRFLSLLMHESAYTYTMTLTVILMGIVLGSMLTSGFFDRLRQRVFAFGAIQIAIGIVSLATLMMPESMWSGRLDPDYIGSQLRNVMLVLLVPAVLSGMSFPLAVRIVVNQPAESGVGVGKMTAINTCGGIAGSLAIGFLVLPQLGLQLTLMLITGTSLVIGFAAWFLLEHALRARIRVGLAIAAASLWLAIPQLTRTRLPGDFLAESGQLVEFHEGLRSCMAVLRKPRKRMLEIDRMWQGSNRKNHQIMAAHVPMLLHPDPKKIVVVGMGVGQTASRFLIYPIEQLDCIEIESGLMPLVKRHFESDWMDDQRVQFVIEDGRNFLTHTDATYDVISIEVGQVFRPSAASFYTAEFYRRARQRLNPNGLLCQFVPIASFDVDEFRTVIRTFLDAFPQSVLWYNRSELLLLGTTADSLSLSEERLRLLEDNDVLRRDLQYAYWNGPAHFLNRKEVFLAGFLAGPVGLGELADGARVYRDDRPYLEYTTWRAKKNAKLEIIDLIQAHKDPIQSLVDAPLESPLQPMIESIRNQNLRDIVADATARTAKTLQGHGKEREAIALLHQALDWNNQNSYIVFKLGAALGKQGEFDAAINLFRQAIEIGSEFEVEIIAKRAEIYYRWGKYELAVSDFETAIELGPDYAPAYNNFAWLLAVCPDVNYRDAEKAIRYATRACELDDWQNYESLDTLAAAYGASGAYADAARWQTEAVALAPETANVAELRSRLEHYELQRPYVGP